MPPPQIHDKEAPDSVRLKLEPCDKAIKPAENPFHRSEDFNRRRYDVGPGLSTFSANIRPDPYMRRSEHSTTQKEVPSEQQEVRRSRTTDYASDYQVARATSQRPITASYNNLESSYAKN